MFDIKYNYFLNFYIIILLIVMLNIVWSLLFFLHIWCITFLIFIYYI